MQRDESSLDWSLLERVVAGDASPSDHDALRAWVGEDPDRQALVAQFTDAVERMRDRRPRYDAAAGWTVLAAKLRSRHQPRRSSGAFAVRQRSLVRPAIGVAAGMCLGAVLTWWAARHPSGPPPAPRQVLATARGQRATIRLSDGSRVTLAPDSRLLEDAAFGQGARNVTLLGQAYFEVVHDSTHPFTVSVPGARIRDLGTTFVVEAYPARGGSAATHNVQAQVVVASGAVLLDAAARPGTTARHAVVAAGELGRVDTLGATAVLSGADFSSHFRWTTGDLVFDNTPLGDAIPTLERWYDITIVLADSTLARRHITGAFHDAPLPHVLNTLTLVLHARYTRVGHSVTLTPAPATPANGHQPRS